MKTLRSCLLLAALFVQSALAQTPAPTPAPVPPAPSPAPVPAPPKPAAPDASKLPVRERERTIYVPYDELEKVFQDGGKGVFLPYREFLDLWNELTLKRDEDKEKPAPTDGVVSKGRLHRAMLKARPSCSMRSSALNRSRKAGSHCH